MNDPNSEEIEVAGKIVDSLREADWDYFRGISDISFVNDENMKFSFNECAQELKNWKNNFEIEYNVMLTKSKKRVVGVFLFPINSNSYPIQFGFSIERDKKNSRKIEILSVLINIFYVKT